MLLFNVLKISGRIEIIKLTNLKAIAVNDLDYYQL